MKKILITGGAGFIGSHIALLLLLKGHDVLIFDSFVNSSSKAIKAIRSYLDLPISFPSTTNCKEPSLGGIIIKY